MDVRAVENAIAPILRAALEDIADRATANIREAISIPVEYAEGGLIIRSSPGEPPRREDGALMAGIDFNIVDGEGLPELYITAERLGMGDADAARVLEDGGLNGQGHYVAPRPYMAPEAEAIRGYGPEIVRNHLAG